MHRLPLWKLKYLEGHHCSALIHEVKADGRAPRPEHWAKDVCQQWAVPVLTVRSEDEKPTQLEPVTMASLTALWGAGPSSFLKFMLLLGVNE